MELTGREPITLGYWIGHAKIVAGTQKCPLCGRPMYCLAAHSMLPVSIVMGSCGTAHRVVPVDLPLMVLEYEK